MTSIDLSHKPRTLNETFSFHVAGSRPARIREQTELADAAVVTGRAGPASVRQLRREGWDKPVLFDRAAYLDPKLEIDPWMWVDEQHAAGADRTLTPGCWVSAAKGHDPFASQIDSEVELAMRFDATCLLAIDYRWLSDPNRFRELRRCLPEPVALVLVAVGDPLEAMGAVDALVALCHENKSMSILRCDHGAIGALANGAAHGSVGLTATYRHGVPPDRSARAVPNDRTPRVFVRELMDWFRGSRIAEWSTTEIPLACQCQVCGGRRLERFAAKGNRAEADLHNQAVLASLADDILSIPDPIDRRHVFSRMCAQAIDRYNTMGYWTKNPPISQQLQQWAFHSQ